MTTSGLVHEAPTRRIAVAIYCMACAVVWFIVSPMVGVDLVAAQQVPLGDWARWLAPLPAGQQLSRLGRRSVAIAPDGRTIAYIANQRIYVATATETRARPLAGSHEDPLDLTFSPDGQWLAYFTAPATGDDYTLSKIAVAGGAPITVAMTHQPYGASWSRELIVFASNKGGSHDIETVPAAGGIPHPIISVGRDEMVSSPELVDDHHVLFTFRAKGVSRWDDADLLVAPLDSGSARTMLVHGGLDGHVLANGTLVYFQNGSLFRLAYDSVSRRVRGAATRLIEGVRGSERDLTGIGEYAISHSGALIYVGVTRADAPPTRPLLWVDRAGHATPVGAPPASYMLARVSPDGNRIALATDAPTPEIQIWTSSTQSLTPLGGTAGSRTVGLTWTRDGGRVVFPSDSNAWTIISAPVDGAGGRDTLLMSAATAFPSALSPDGRSLIYGSLSDDFNESNLFVLPTVGVPHPFTATLTDASNASISPDGRWVAYESKASGNAEVFVRALQNDSAPAVRVSTGGGETPAWSPNGRELFYVTPAPSPSLRELISVPVAVAAGGQPTLTFGAPTTLFDVTWYYRLPFGRSWDVSPDGMRFLMIDYRTAPPGDNLMVVGNLFGPARQPAVAAPPSTTRNLPPSTPPIPDEDGVYLVTRVVDHAQPGYLPVTTETGAAWMQVGARVKVVSASVRAPTSANDRFDMWYSYRKTKDDVCGPSLLRLDGVWRYARTSQSSYISCRTNDAQIADDPRGTVARLAVFLGTTPALWQVVGDRVTGTFASVKPVFQRGEPPLLRFTLRNPADAPPVSRSAELESWAWGPSWRFTITRDGVPLPVSGHAGDAYEKPELFPPGDSAVTGIRLRDWSDSVAAPGHYIVQITHNVSFAPPFDTTSRAMPPRSSPGGDRTFRGTVQFDIANTVAAGAVKVSGHITGAANLRANAHWVWLQGGTYSERVLVQPDGSYAFPLVLPGTYQIGATTQMAPTRTIVVGDRDVTDADVAVVSRTVSGRVALSPGLPPLHLRLALRFNENVTVAIDPEPDGTFTAVLPTGRWFVGTVSGLPPTTTIASMTYGTTDLLQHDLVVAVSDAGTLQITLERPSPAPMKFVAIAAGEFTMGCSSADSSCSAQAQPAHAVRISRGFEMSADEVTQRQWRAMMSTNPSQFKGDDRPVAAVSWNEIQEFLSRLNALNDGYRYRLPTEAEWEYAARAGTTGGRGGSPDAMMPRSGAEDRPVGMGLPSAWGLYDMDGNVSELVQDFFAPYTGGPLQVDPTGPSSGDAHVVRGASWITSGVSVTDRGEPLAPDDRRLWTGFRVVRDSVR